MTGDNAAAAILPQCSAIDFRRRFGARQRFSAVDNGNGAGAPAGAGNMDQVLRTVAAIIGQVRLDGDQALLDLTEQFDGVRLERLDITPAAMASAWASLPAGDREALQKAAERIEAFHRRSRPRGWLEPAPDGGWWGQMLRPVARAGIYAPGGRYAYPSTVLMAGIPARVAGVEEVVVATPPRPDGTVEPLLLGAAHLVGADRLILVGGAQAIAAMAYGTATVPRCDLVVGPGNVYVTAAKALVYGQVGIDGLMGPSELAVVADTTADPAWLAADLAAQAEHGPDSVVCLFTTSAELLSTVRRRLQSLMTASSAANILAESLARGVAVLVPDGAAGVELSNVMGPEHLHLYVADPWQLLPAVKHAGAVYLGPWAPVAFGDYAAGPNHILPTGGTARYSGGLTVGTFLRAGSLYAGMPAALQAAGPAAGLLARREGLQAHADSLLARLEGLAPARKGDGGVLESE